MGPSYGLHPRSGRRAAVVLILLGLVACSSHVPPPAPMPQDAPEDWYEPEGVAATASDPCPMACDKLRKYACPEGAPTPTGHTCEERCQAYEKSKLVTYHPRCVARIQGKNACQAAKACEKQP